MAEGWPDLVDRIVRAVYHKQVLAVETICEMAVLTGKYGVLIRHYDDGFTVEVSPLVPYGKIAEMPAEAYEKWKENGCPM